MLVRTIISIMVEIVTMIVTTVAAVVVVATTIGVVVKFKKITVAMAPGETRSSPFLLSAP